MNRLSQVLLVLVLVIFVTGCYNNSHIRTQRVLKPDEKIISGNVGLNLVAPSIPYEHSSIDESGIAGLRAGVSYLGFHRGYEQGVGIGYGTTENGFEDYMFSYDIRKVQTTTKSRPYRTGLHVELNSLSSSGDNEGQVFQFRPYMISTTSENKIWYGGIHGLFSFGDISASKRLSIRTNNYSYSHPTVAYEYSISSLGIGATVGNELRFWNLLFQTQLDFSIINQRHELTDDRILDLDIDSDFYAEPLNVTGPVITIGMAFHRAPSSQKPEPHQSLTATSSIGLSSVPPQEKQESRFDPFTGELITPTQPAGPVKFDPFTGEPIDPDTTPKYDPLTGNLVSEAPGTSKQSPYSLLKPGEKFALALKELKISTLNGKATPAQVIDLTDVGLVYQREIAQSTTITIPYAHITQISFQGERRGFAYGLKAAATSCGVCIGVPLGLSILTGEYELLGAGILGAPVAALGSAVLGSLSRDSYELRFMLPPPTLTPSAYRQQMLVQLVRMYIDSGFPSYDLIQAGKK